MRKRILFSVVGVFLMCATAKAQEAKPGGDTSRPEAINMEKLSKKPISITGVVNNDGTALLDGKASRTYKVLNPDFVKENAGERVKVSAKVSKDNSEILISSVMVLDDEPVVAKKDDAAFRR